MVANANERWRALRALHEGAPADAALLAAASGCARSTIQRRIEREGWSAPIGDGDELLERLADTLVAQVEALRVETQGAFDKSQIELAASIIRTVEKIRELTRSAGSQKVSHIKRDEEMADVLARIDRRIIELAREYARVLVGNEHNAS